MKVLITGNQGFVGRHFTNRMLEEGHRVTTIDIANGGIDARDFFRKDNTQFDLVIHLAAVVGGRKMIEGEPLALAVDLAIDSEMFTWALRTQPGAIVYYSSSAAYPILYQHQLTGRELAEDDIDLNFVMTPDYSYGWAKLTGEMLAAHARAKGLKVHIFRPFSGYGSDQSLDYPFPSFIARAKAKSDPFEVWGTGEQVRDFIHIDDVIEGTLAGIKADIRVANLCTGIPTTFNQLAQMVMEVAGYKGEVVNYPSEPSGVHYRLGNPTYMESFYTPKISLLEGIERAFAG